MRFFNLWYDALMQKDFALLDAIDAKHYCKVNLCSRFVSTSIAQIAIPFAAIHKKDPRSTQIILHNSRLITRDKKADYRELREIITACKNDALFLRCLKAELTDQQGRTEGPRVFNEIVQPFSIDTLPQDLTSERNPEELRNRTPHGWLRGRMESFLHFRH